MFELPVTAGDIIDIIINDSWGDGCEGSVDFYVDYTFESSYVGPEEETNYHSHTIVSTGTLQIGWTPSLYNTECSFELFDSTGTSLYASGLDPDSTIPSMTTGTDSDDNDVNVH